MKTLFNHFEVLEDPRDIRGKKHELINILIMTIYGTLCGYTDFVNMVDFLTLHEDYFLNLLNLENGIPSHDTFSRVFSLIKPEKFMDIFIDWIKEIVGQNGLHIAIDAIGTQEEIANKIVYDKKAAYILKVKDNQKDLKDDIKTYCDLELKKDSPDIDILETNYEKEHGRIEKRPYYISYDTECIHNKEKWKFVKTIGRMDVYREENGKVSTSKNYYILSQQFSTEKFKNITREHWNIECSLHWR